MQKEEVDYKQKAEDLAKRNVELEGEVKSLTAAADQLKAQYDALKKEFDNTVAAHNQIRDHVMTALSTLNAQVSNSRFLSYEELAQQRQQAEQIKKQLRADEKKR